MRLEIFRNEVSLTASLEKAIQRKVEKIETRLKRYHPDSAHLEIRLDHDTRLKTFECVLLLKAFKDSMHSKKSAPELRVAVDRSFDAMMRELEQYRLKINKSRRAGS